MKTQYVVGLLFSVDRHGVALIRKTKPKWQAGMLNGVGGHVEPGEAAPQAMVREFREEPGTEVTAWELFATLTGPDFEIRFYSAFDDAAIRAVATTTEEAVERWPVKAALAGQDLIPNLRVLIPLALDQTGIKKPVHLIDEVRAAS